MQAIKRPFAPNGGIRVMSYNILAQTLVRRERFPGSGNSLKWAVRHSALLEELAHYAPDLLCMQEVDVARQQWWEDVLRSRGMEVLFYARSGKTHGLLLAWNQSKFRCAETVRLDYDECALPHQALTGNIAALVKLEEASTGLPLVFATTHLYWRPTANYERLRQFVALFGAIAELGCARVVIGADTNSAPWSPAYQFVLHGRVTPEMHQQLVESAEGRKFDDASPEFLADPASCVDELVARAAEVASVAADLQSSQLAFFGQEPKFTNWTPDYRDTLDYIFVSRSFEVTSAVEPVPTENLPVGLPFKYEDGKGYPSDHVPVVAALKTRG